MPQHSTTVRFDADLWELLTAEAAAGGVSAATFVRDAAVIRLGYLAGRRRDARAEESLASIADRAGARRVSTDARLLDPGRLAALRRTGLLDTEADPAFDRITRIVRRVLNVPVALVSLVDEDRQFFKSCLGLPEPWGARRETPLSHSFCQHVVVSHEPLAIGDARGHPVLRDNLAIEELGVVAYLGVPLIVEGEALGSLCAIDGKPRHWGTADVEMLTDLAGAVVAEIERR